MTTKRTHNRRAVTFTSIFPSRRLEKIKLKRPSEFKKFGKVQLEWRLRLASFISSPTITYELAASRDCEGWGRGAPQRCQHLASHWRKREHRGLGLGSPPDGVISQVFFSTRCEPKTEVEASNLWYQKHHVHHLSIATIAGFSSEREELLTTSPYNLKEQPVPGIG